LSFILLLPWGMGRVASGEELKLRKLYRVEEPNKSDEASQKELCPSLDSVQPQRKSEPSFSTSESHLEDTRRATPGELLAAEVTSIMTREGACLGATVLRNATNGRAVGVGSELPGASAKIDEFLASGFSPIGVFV